MDIVKMYRYPVYEGKFWYGMAAVALVLLAISALLAGLTLAVCGLDMIWLQMVIATGSVKEQKQAAMLAKIKRHGTWMLCSFIIISVAAGEIFPIIVQSLWPGSQQWVPILISTLLVLIFAELLPQYLVPRHAIPWGYHCRHIIWFCMWLTAIVSYPLGWLLDSASGNKKRLDIFTNDQLAVLIKHHERAEKNGGMLGQDATRVILGALSLDSRKICGDLAQPLEAVDSGNEKDLEKADPTPMARGMIVKWSNVETVNIDDTIDMAFIQKVKRWSYSRIPVVGDRSTEDMAKKADRMKVYGFLHIKNLVGIHVVDSNSKDTRLTVRDLLLYPLPIVHEDMHVYDLLNMFQLGMSRMAAVIPTPALLEGGAMYKNKGNPSYFSIDAQVKAAATLGRDYGKVLDGFDWTTDFLDAAKGNAKDPTHRNQNIAGIRLPDPVGIITFEDVIDTLLQKSSRDEKDIFTRSIATPLNHQANNASHCLSAHARNPQVLVPRNLHESVLRKRNVSSRRIGAGAFDGADERSSDGAEGATLKVSKVRTNHSESFRIQENAAAIQDMGACDDTAPTTQKCTMPRLVSSYSSLNSQLQRNTPSPSLVMPVASTSIANSDLRARFIADLIGTSNNPFIDHHVRGGTDITGDNDGDSVSLSIDSSVYDAFPSSRNSHNNAGDDAMDEKCQDQPDLSLRFRREFPAHLLHSSTDKENHVYATSTLPRKIGRADIGILREKANGETPVREKSFHDDRALLPSQRSIVNKSLHGGETVGVRSISLWV